MDKNKWSTSYRRESKPIYTPQAEQRTKPKRSKLSFVAMLLGVLVIAFMISTILKSDTSGNSARSIGTMIGLGIVMPCVMATGVAVLLNIIGFLANNKTLTLISAIFYVIGLILMPLWGFVGIPSMILQFIAYAKMKKRE